MSGFLILIGHLFGGGKLWMSEAGSSVGGILPSRTGIQTWIHDQYRCSLVDNEGKKCW